MGRDRAYAAQRFGEAAGLKLPTLNAPSMSGRSSCCSAGSCTDAGGALAKPRREAFPDAGMRSTPIQKQTSPLSSWSYFLTKVSLPSSPTLKVTRLAGDLLDLVAIAHQPRIFVARHQHLAGRIEREGAREDAFRVDVLDQRRLAGLLIDLEHRDVVDAAGEHLLPLELLGVMGAVRHVNERPLGWKWIALVSWRDLPGSVPSRQLLLKRGVWSMPSFE